MSDSVNPYAAPEADGIPLPKSTSLELPDAPLGTRFANLVIDYVARLVLSLTLRAVMSSVELNGVYFPVLSAIFSVVLYYIVCESLFSCTLGKLITRTRVVTNSGQRPSFLQIVGRSFARFVPFEPFSFLGGAPTGWHDRWSGTRVVRISS